MYGTSLIVLTRMKSACVLAGERHSQEGWLFGIGWRTPLSRVLAVWYWLVNATSQRVGCLVLAGKRHYREGWLFGMGWCIHLVWRNAILILVIRRVELILPCPLQLHNTYLSGCCKFPFYFLVTKIRHEEDRYQAQFDLSCIVKNHQLTFIFKLY